MDSFCILMIGFYMTADELERKHARNLTIRKWKKKKKTLSEIYRQQTFADKNQSFSWRELIAFRKLSLTSSGLFITRKNPDMRMI